MWYNSTMNQKLQRPSMKLADTKVSEKDMIYFALGLDAEDYILPSQRNDYRTDERAVRLLQDIKNGKNLSGKNFSGINLKGADISGVDFTGSDFTGAIFYQTKATGCNFTGCNFTEAYFEDTDFSDSILSDCIFTKTYLRHLNLENAEIDEDLEKRLSAMEFLIHQIETGKIDIHCLSRSELMCLDLRRLDMSKVDVSDLDLSMFVLEGVNLRGVYINPLQKISMDQWQKDLLAVETLKEKKLKEENLKILKERRKELENYAKEQTDIQPIKTKNPERPRIKKDEFEKENRSHKKEEIKPSEEENTLPPTHKIKQQKNSFSIKEKKHKNRN